MSVRIVTGGRGVGKSLWVEHYARATAAVGCISRRRFRGRWHHGYDALLLPRLTSLPLARVRIPGDPTPGTLSEPALLAGATELLESAERTEPAERTEGAAGYASSEDASVAAEHWFAFRRFSFRSETFAQVESFFSTVLGQGRGPGVHGAPFVLDEVGPLEMQRRGFYPVLALLLRSGVELTVTTRPSLVEWLMTLVEEVRSKGGPAAPTRGGEPEASAGAGATRVIHLRGETH